MKPARVKNIIMGISSSKQNSIASDVIFLKDPDKMNIKHENVYQSNISCCTSTEAHNFVKFSKQNTQQYIDLNNLGKIYLYPLPSQNCSLNQVLSEVVVNTLCVDQ